MASGWAEMLKELERQTGALEPDIVWTKFEEVSTTSPRTAQMDLARSLGAELSPTQRAKLALLVASILERVEWPSEWEQARGPLVAALDGLLRQVNPYTTESLAAALGLSSDPRFLSDYTTAFIAKVLLSEPCSQREILYLAVLCSSALSGWVLAFNVALARLHSMSNQDAIKLAVTNLNVALQQYAQAARAMNEVAGRVLFDGLDARMEGG